MIIAIFRGVESWEAGESQQFWFKKCYSLVLEESIFFLFFSVLFSLADRMQYVFINELFSAVWFEKENIENVWALEMIFLTLSFVPFWSSFWIIKPFFQKLSVIPITRISKISFLKWISKQRKIWVERNLILPPLTFVYYQIYSNFYSYFCFQFFKLQEMKLPSFASIFWINEQFDFLQLFSN